MTVNLEQFIVSAPGKVILFGEHAAVYNKPAIAASIALRTYMLVAPTPESPDLVLEFPSIDLRFSYPIKDLPWDIVDREALASNKIPTELDEKVLDALQPLVKTLPNSFQQVAVLAFFYLYLHLCNPEMQACTFVTQSTLPVGAGLGSSATFAVCLSSALLILGSQLKTPASQITTVSGNDQDVSAEHELINAWAFIGEKCLHGNPSGIDNTVACRGGAVLFQRPNTMLTIKKFPEMKLILTNTKHPRRTADLVARVGDLLRTFEKGTSSILDAIEHVTREAFELLVPKSSPNSQMATLKLENATQDKAIQRLIQLVRINHGLLVSLGVSHPKLEKIRAVGDELNIGETKLTGAGGGGCAITLLHVDEEDKVQEKLAKFEESLTHEDVGFELFDTILGGPGVGYGKLERPILIEDFHGYKRKELEGACAWEYWN